MAYVAGTDQSYCHNMYPKEAGYWWTDAVTTTAYPQNDNASREVRMAPGNDCLYAHDMITNTSVQVLQEFAADLAAGANQSMFLYIAYTDPHAGGWNGTAETGAPVPSDGAYAGEAHHSTPALHQ